MRDLGEPDADIKQVKALLAAQIIGTLDDQALFIKTIRKLKYRAKSALQEWLSARHRSSEQLSLTFSDVFHEYRQTSDPTQCRACTGDCLDRAGASRNCLKRADTHGLSEAVFGLAYLLGIEWMPRIRNWRSLQLYSADANTGLRATSRLYSGAIDWGLSESNWEVYGRLIMAIRTGRVTAWALLTRPNSYSRRNTLYRALQELGRVVRTIYLLGWINEALWHPYPLEYVPPRLA